MGLSFPSARENMSAQLIGSRISLISQNDVRYEGFLYSLDPEKREVVLQNVRCFGTEDRKEGEGKVEPVEEPYSFIYFQESQIKDLSVIENPRPEEFMMGMPGHDMNYPPYGYPMQNSFMMGNQFGYPSYPYSPYGFGGYGYDPMMGQMGGMPGYDFGYPNYPMGPGGPMAPPNLNPENADQQQPASASQQKAAPSEGNASDAQKKDSQPQQAAATEAGSAQSEKQAQQPSQAPQQKQAQDKTTSQEAPKKTYPSTGESSSSSGGNDKSRSNRSRSRNRGGRGRRNDDQSKSKGKIAAEAFEGDFDFESSLAKFDKEKFAADLLGDVAEDGEGELP